MADIYKFPQETGPFDSFLDMLRLAYNEDRIKGFICIYEARYPEGKDIEGFVGTLDKYWFGESSTQCLGLCEMMKADILDWVRKKNEEKSEDG